MYNTGKQFPIMDYSTHVLKFIKHLQANHWHQNKDDCYPQESSNTAPDHGEVHQP